MPRYDQINWKQNAWTRLCLYMPCWYWALVCVVTTYWDQHQIRHIHLWKVLFFPTRGRWLPASRQLPFLRKSLKPLPCWNICKCSSCKYSSYAGGMSRAGFHPRLFCFLVKFCFTHLCWFNSGFPSLLFVLGDWLWFMLAKNVTHFTLGPELLSAVHTCADFLLCVLLRYIAEVLVIILFVCFFLSRLLNSLGPVSTGSYYLGQPCPLAWLIELTALCVYPCTVQISISPFASKQSFKMNSLCRVYIAVPRSPCPL